MMTFRDFVINSIALSLILIDFDWFSIQFHFCYDFIDNLEYTEYTRSRGAWRLRTGIKNKYTSALVSCFSRGGSAELINSCVFFHKRRGRSVEDPRLRSFPDAVYKKKVKWLEDNNEVQV